MMDAKLNSADVNGKVEDGSVDKRLLRDSKTTDLQEHVQADCVTAVNLPLFFLTICPTRDLCAAILLACLFCHPLDCLLATVGGCSECVWSLCSYLCGCEPATLQPLLDVTHHCDLCRCLGARCFLCDCPICDICLQATECLDLAMEISQMLFH
ncbi:hypothetical protein F2P81_013062 [Scophthalmus maximus]|uniref:MyoD family inhibitor domain-containing protein n=1 Tax=Scophthalmus maximus TaxID=52904 RepID=A0A6A4SW69_SCOMX|nr:hypothetical protein F2P81_013062 [Scophthalmus maximus]